jgi:hypothetical protein
MKKIKFITAIYNDLFGSEFGGRINRQHHYKWSLISLLRMTDADFVCYTSKRELDDLRSFFYEKNNISESQLKFIEFELSDKKNFSFIDEYKNIEEIRKSDRCYEIQYNKFFWFLNEDLSYEYYYWLDAGLSHCGLLPDKYLTYCDEYRGYYDSYFFDNNFLNKLLDKTGENLVVFSKDNHRNFWSGTVPPQYYNEYDSSVHIIGGLFGGKKENMKWFVDEFDKTLNLITNEQKKIYSEEQIMSLIYQNNKSKFKTFDFDVWWHETNGPKGLPEDFFVVNKSFYKSLEDVNI